MSYAASAAILTSSLELDIAPVALAGIDTPPAGVAAAPIRLSDCSFRRGAGATDPGLPLRSHTCKGTRP